MNPALVSLLSGYSREYRAKKVFVVLTAYFDDSGSEQDERNLVVAGYVHRAESWIAFSDDWQVALDASPKIEFLHMVDAQNLSGQFKNWDPTDKDRKVDALASVIAKYEPWSIACTVSRSVFGQILKPIVPYEIRAPYFPCFYGFILNLAKWHASLGLTLPVDFIFDEQGSIGAEAVVWYEIVKSFQPPEIARLLGASPIFRDDKQVVPLQAADLLAWHLRRRKEQRNQAEQRPVFTKLLPLLHAEVEITAEVLTAMAEQLSRVPNLEMAWRKPKT